MILVYDKVGYFLCKFFHIKWGSVTTFPLPLSYSLEIHSISSNIFFKKSTYFYPKSLVGFMKKTLKQRPESGFEPLTAILDKTQKE